MNSVDHTNIYAVTFSTWYISAAENSLSTRAGFKCGSKSLTVLLNSATEIYPLFNLSNSLNALTIISCSHFTLNDSANSRNALCPTPTVIHSGLIRVRTSFIIRCSTGSIIEVSHNVTIMIMNNAAPHTHTHIHTHNSTQHNTCALLDVYVLTLLTVGTSSPNRAISAHFTWKILILLSSARP